MGGAGTTRFFLVDDHETFRLGSRSVIESNPVNRVVAEASSVREAVRRLDETPFDVLVIDSTMPGANGLAMIREMRRQRRRERVLVVSMHASADGAAEAFAAGATGFATKADSAQSLEIGQELSISAKTVDSHQTRIFRKLHVHSRFELLRFAFRHHLIGDVGIGEGSDDDDV